LLQRASNIIQEWYREITFAVGIIIGVIMGLAAKYVVSSIPTNLDKALTLEILKALLTSGTVAFGLAGVLITFTLSSVNSRTDSLSKDRLATWTALQNALTQNMTQANSLFNPKIKEFDDEIQAAQAYTKRIALFSVLPLLVLTVQLLVSVRAMAEVGVATLFPYDWVLASVVLLLFALFLLAVMVVETGLPTKRRP
jgi:hypothetical protein